MSDSSSPAELIDQLTRMNEKIINYGSVIVAENIRLKETLLTMEKELNKLRNENKTLRKGMLTYSSN